MPARTVRGSTFTIWIDGKQIIVKHLPCKGNRCRVIVPPGAVIETPDSLVASDPDQCSSTTNSELRTPTDGLGRIDRSNPSSRNAR